MGDVFDASWAAEVLTQKPLIAPARQFVYPQRIAGEEEALSRGALELMVRPRLGGSFLATFALGFRDPAVPTGLFRSPVPDELCALAGGYGYVIDTSAPERSTLLPLKPVTAVVPVPEASLLLFAGFHSLLAWGVGGVLWQTARLSWDGLRITGVANGEVDGFGWDLMSDREVAFTVDLRTGLHQGGAAPGQS